MSTDPPKYDVCVVGAGIAGAALAAYLGKHGARVAVVEQNWEEPDEIIGELLQPGGVLKLREMGFADALEGFDAQPVYGYAMFLNHEHIRMSYPEEGKNGEISCGYGFRYGRFVQKLRSCLKKYDHVDAIAGKVTQILEDNQGNVRGVLFQNADAVTEEISAHVTVVCQGSSSRLRTGLSKADLEVKGFMLGMIIEDIDPPFRNHGHVVIADPAPVLIYPVTSNKLRVLIDFPKNMKVKKGRPLEAYLINKIAPQLPAGLQEAFIRTAKEGKFKYKSTCLLAAKPILKNNVVLLGDSLNQRHPTTGGGMTVALTDALALGVELLKCNLEDSEEVQSAVKTFYKNRYKENAAINILAYSLYCVFKHPMLRKACFYYLKKGGNFSAEPMSILSGISRNRLLLVRHFFLVAFYGVFNTLKPIPTPAKIAQSFRLLRDAVAIITPLLIDEVPMINSKQPYLMVKKMGWKQPH